MKNFSPLQVVLYVIFIAAIIFAVLIFSGRISIGQTAQQKVSGDVTAWGTLPYANMSDYLNSSVGATYPDLTVSYVEKDPATFQSDLVDALASGRGPDIILLDPSQVIQNSERLFVLPFASLSKQSYLSTFVDQAELFMTDQGVVALPVLIDPFVMYYNRGLLTSSFAVKAPETWNDLVALNKQVTRKDDAGKLLTETAGLGTYDNVTHAKGLLATLVMQAGNRLVAFDPQKGAYASTLNLSAPGATDLAISSALGFYTSFANPNDTDHYSWNASLPSDQSQFVAGRLALYFGPASEITTIRARNPNLNFGVAMMPQSDSSRTRATYGRMLGIAVMKSAKNPQLAFIVENAAAQKAAVSHYLDLDSTYAPARRDLLSSLPSDDAVKSLIYRSAIISRDWLDPDASQTSALFKRFVDQVNAGLVQPGSSANLIDSLLQGILTKIQKNIVPSGSGSS